MVARERGFLPAPAEIREPIAPGAEELFGDWPIERFNHAGVIA